ncbi:ABC transporter permease [Pullulanibacillus sp. KACC 23026]|uniref:ABC transporter permease n=1 Tax=Pullulanibacillus sp. KACC 23026 TaxID=3028315 RepID=UPI0023AE901D|nr:ABC transporter permease [Pullulanibacillus sp. KACC 23026]WEG12025.1 ABC transporter permease [Pullulanibacillus sp. KACC 23026]
MRLSQLYSERRQAWTKITIRYTKLVANSGFMFSLYMGLIIGSVYYQKALKTLPAHFPAAFILTILFGAAVIPTSIRTYIQRADLVLLLPAEGDLTGYFRAALRDSWGRQSIYLIFLSAVAMPLYLKTLDASPAHYAVIVLLLILLKGWNIYGVWCESRLEAIRGLNYARALLSLIFIYLLLVKANLWFIAALIIILAIYSWLGYQPLLLRGSLNWILLADEEARLSMRFLRIANWVTDVPGLIQPIKPRRYIDLLIKPWVSRIHNVYALLYLKTFLRAGDYFGIFVRLTLIGALLMILTRYSLVLSIVIAAAVIFLTAFQLLALGKHEFPEALEGLYPINGSEKRRGYLYVMRVLIMSQTVLLTLVFIVTHLQNGLTAVMMLIAGILFSTVWLQWVSGRQLNE